MQSTIETIDGQNWIIEHNLDEFGLHIDHGFINWYFRTEEDNRTPENFCSYLVSKDPHNLQATHVRTL